MTFRKSGVTPGAAPSAQHTVAGSEEAVQLALEQLRSMGQRFRTASKEQQVLIQATHVQWATMVSKSYYTTESDVCSLAPLRLADHAQILQDGYTYDNIAIHCPFGWADRFCQPRISSVNCSGQLFHVFTQDQIADYQRTRLSGPSDESRDYATCVVSAIAAVGLQYVPNDVDSGVGKDYSAEVWA
ncbi:hypothetical protein PG987_013879 [Apiospora arundinis]